MRGMIMTIYKNIESKLDIIKNMYYNEKKTMRKIASYLNCSQDSIYYVMKKYNLKRRTFSEAQSMKKLSQKTKDKISKYFKNRFIKEKHHNWKGGTFKSEGYTFIYQPEHLDSNHLGYMKRSRLLMEKYIGRRLGKKEVVHHLDFNRDNDDINNLHLFNTQNEHLKYHRMLKTLVIEELIGKVRI